MDSDACCLINDNLSVELDDLFCGFFSCCANLLREDDEQEPFEQNYLVFNQESSYLVQYYTIPRGLTNKVKEPQKPILVQGFSVQKESPS